MLTILSPAKKLNTTNKVLLYSSQPQFVEEAEQLVNVLKKYKPAKLSKLMGISAKLADMNFERYLNWNKDHSSENAGTAILTFDGEVYSGLGAKSYSKKEMDYAQSHLRILSGLYGVLRPLDLIHPYRLEMGTKLKIGRKNNLYEFWNNKLVDEINNLLKKHKEKVLINLASTEYFKSINQKKLEYPMVTPVFKDFNNGQYKVVMVYAKKARGLMASYIIKNRIEKISDIRGFDADGYRFDAATSTVNELVFLRG